MTEKELKEQIKNPSGGYLFYGDEDYLKDFYVKSIRKAILVDPSVADFNETVLDDETFSISALEDALSSPAFMSDKKLIRIKLTSYSVIPESDKESFTEILSYLYEYPDTVLVLSFAPDGFDAGTEKKPTALFLSFKNIIKCVEFPQSSDTKLMRWIERHLNEMKVGCDTSSLELMLRLCGKSMYRLSGEVEKVGHAALAKGMSAITPALVESVVTLTPEEDAFYLANSVASGNIEAALESLGRAKRRGDNPVKLLAMVSATLCDLASVKSLMIEGETKQSISAILKMHEYKVKLNMQAVAGISQEKLDTAVAMCVEADYKTKSAQLGYIPLERLICSANFR